MPTGGSVSISASGASGTQAGYTGDPGPGWALTWSDDFTSQSSLKDWTTITGGNGWGDKDLQYYDPSGVALAPSGGLVLTANKGGNGQQCWYGACTYTTGRMQTKGTFSQEYGLFEAKIKLPAGKGIWPAFWMEGANIDTAGWPGAGEIDVVEISNKTPGLVSGYLHAPDESYGARKYLTAQELSGGYHVFGVDWTASGMTWLLDGKPYGHVSAYPGWPFNQPFFLILDVNVGGGWPGSPDASTQFPAEMNVAWVRVYKQS